MPDRDWMTRAMWSWPLAPEVRGRGRAAEVERPEDGGDAERDADAVLGRLSHAERPLEPRRQMSTGGGFRIAADRLRTRSRAGGGARVPVRVASEHELPDRR